MRLIPFAYSNFIVSTIVPSDWFAMGNDSEISPNFRIEYNENGRFKSITLRLQEEEFSSLIVDAYFAANTH